MKNDNIMDEMKKIEVRVSELATELARNAVLKDSGYNQESIIDEKDGWVKYKPEAKEDFDCYYDYYYQILESF